MAARLSKAMISALRQLAGDRHEPEPWGGTLHALEQRGLVTRAPGDPFDATLTEAGKAMAAEYKVNYIYQRASTMVGGPTLEERFREAHAGSAVQKNRARTTTGGDQRVTDPTLSTPLPNAAALLTERFARAFGRLVAGIIEAGDILIEGHEQLGGAYWRRWVDDHLPIGVRQARRLICISRSDELRRSAGDAALADLLPPSIRSLESLARLDAADFGLLIEAGAINPEISAAEVRSALVRLRAESDPLSQPAPMPVDGRYGALLVDPPWPFETWGKGSDRGADQHYPTMTVQEIIQLPVADIGAPDSLLFVWCPAHHLSVLGHIMMAWDYRWIGIGFHWKKTDGPGMGYWTRKCVETCYVGRRGSPRRLSAGVSELIEAPRGAHSAKPAEVRERIQALVGGPYLEMFAREAVDGWDAWGHLEGGGRWEQ